MAEQNTVSGPAAAEFDADVIIVGAGVCGSVLAKELTAKEPGLKVLMVEAGPLTSTTPEGYASYVRQFHGALAKIPNSPWPDSPYAPQPTVLQFHQIPQGTVDAGGYYVQRGPLPFGSEFDRTAGGTSMHWLGQTPRMLPNDMRLNSAYGVGVDWPFDYQTLRPFYERAEYELGVAGEVSDQRYPGVDMAAYYGGYKFPMHGLPKSWADRITTPDVLRAKLDPTKFPALDYPYGFDAIGTPQARNSLPNLGYVNPDTGVRGYVPVGAVGAPERGQRCEGNASCTPICPVQAKYNALKSLGAAQGTGRVQLHTQMVATQVLFDTSGGRVTGIRCSRYNNFDSPDISSVTVRARVYVLASNTIENAKLLLNSNAPNRSQTLGRNLMDNVTMLRWGLASKPLGVYRGPGSTSNIPTFRDGPFRRKHAAFILPLDNWGWIWPAFGPDAQVAQLMAGGWPLQAPGATQPQTIAPQHMFGKRLRECAGNAISRQFFTHFEMEQLPDAANRVTVDPAYRDALGVPRPVLSYKLSDYEKETFRVAVEMSKELLPQIGVQDFTAYNPWDTGYFDYQGQGYTFYGAGHIAGTARMGSDPSQSYVDPQLRCHEHRNLFIVGGAPMPTIGTGNPTLTMTALTYRAADAIRQQLHAGVS